MKPVVDPYTVKVRKLNHEVTEDDLLNLLGPFGEITRVKIPMDEERGTNKGIGFVTFKSMSSATEAIAEGYVKFDFFELPVEPATQSKGRMDRMGGGGDRGGGGRGGRGGFGGDREGRSERPPVPEGEYLRRKMD
jgi:nucleolin